MVFVYLLTLALSRILGRKLISQMTFFDFILGIMIGNAAVNSSTVKENPSLSSFVSLLIIFLLTLIIDIIHMKSIRFRKFIDSEPVVVIEKGKINDQNVKRLRLSIEELNMLLREKNYFNIADVESAVFETDGKLSVQGKAEKQALTPSDINMVTSYKGLTRDIVIDGSILNNNLQYINKNEHWLKKQLLGYGVHDLKEVFYAGLDSSGNFYVSKRSNKSEEPGIHGIE
jgi:uncharacterized membrane protein YcaP (DUF421 family)